MPEFPLSRPSTPDRRRARGSFVAVLITVCLVAALLPFGDGALPRGGSGTEAQGNAFADLAGYGVLEEAWTVVRDQYVDIGDVPPVDLIRGASTGMVEGLGDVGHSRYLDPDGAERFRRAIDGAPIGVGVSLRSINDFLVIRDVIPGGPAEQAGVLRGDVILTLNGDDVSGLASSDLEPWLDRVVGTPVVMGLYRPMTGQETEITVTQREFAVDTVSWALLPGGVAQIRIASFDRETAPDLADAIVASRAAGAMSIVLDLRDNPGGLVDELVNAVSLFLPADLPVFQTVDAAGTVNRWLTIDGAIAREIPLVVLVNRDSASAAEIMAASLDYYERATVIGQTTFGTGTILYGTDLSDGSSVVIGRQLWETPGGESVWLTGYEPDEEVVLGYGVFPYVPDDGERLDARALAATDDVQLIAGVELVIEDVSEPLAAASGAADGHGGAGAPVVSTTGPLAIDPAGWEGLR